MPRGRCTVYSAEKIGADSDTSRSESIAASFGIELTRWCLRSSCQDLLTVLPTCLFLHPLQESRDLQPGRREQAACVLANVVTSVAANRGGTKVLNDDPNHPRHRYLGLGTSLECHLSVSCRRRNCCTRACLQGWYSTHENMLILGYDPLHLYRELLSWHVLLQLGTGFRCM